MRQKAAKKTATPKKAAGSAGMDAVLALGQPEQKVTPEAPRVVKVALVGSAASTLDQVPWKDRSFEIWGLGWRLLERGDRYFDVHPLGPHRKNVPPNYERHLALLDKPVYLQEVHPAIPNSLKYPRAEVIKRLGPDLDPYSDGEYFASSIAYMLAFAILEEFEEIHIYGVDLLTDGEYPGQRPNTEYLIGVARGLGHRVYVPKEAAILKFDYPYGYGEKPSEGPVTLEILEGRRKQYVQKHKAAMAEMFTADGARQECEQLAMLLRYASRGGTMRPQEGPGSKTPPIVSPAYDPPKKS